jgi:hypothetical protein
MHILLLNEVVAACVARMKEGDCPTTPPVDRERLEDAVVQLASEVKRLRGQLVAAGLCGFDPLLAASGGEKGGAGG